MKMFEPRLGRLMARGVKEGWPEEDSEGVSGSLRAPGAALEDGAAAGTSRAKREFCGGFAPPCAPSVGRVGEPGIRELWEGAPPVREGKSGEPCPPGLRPAKSPPGGMTEAPPGEDGKRGDPTAGG